MDQVCTQKRQLQLGTLGGGGAVVEMEIDSRWDYFRGRRKMGMWDNDDWVLAREGKGPQLPSPSALA